MSHERPRPPVASLKPVFFPQSVAIVGASTRPGSIGRMILHNLIMGDFQGKLFPVNPKAPYIHSIKAYPTIAAIPDPVDLAVLAVPARMVIDVAETCGQHGVKGLLVVTAGFREIGPEGKAREERLARTCQRYGMRLVGPNCLGIFNADPTVKLNATFAPGMPQSGPVGFVSQSGALGIAIWTEIQRRNIGFSQFASIGNRADISGNDLIEAWEEDPNTTIIALYIEAFGSPRRFLELARRVTRKKPIIMVKSGRTKAGARAATSHTGSLSGSDAATQALMDQAGVIRARTIEDMMALLQGFARCPLPKGDRVAILTNAGGPGIMATDALIREGLQLAPLEERTQQALREYLPREASVKNPVDMIASATPEDFRSCLPLLLEDETVDIVIAAFVPPMMIDPSDILRAVTEVRRDYDKPVFMVLMAEERYYWEIPAALSDCPPLFRYPETAAYAAAEMLAHQRWRGRREGHVPRLDYDVEGARSRFEVGAERGQYLDQQTAFDTLEAFGFPTARVRTAHDVDQAVEAAEEIGYPVVLKAAGRQIVHKSDVGAVITGLENREQFLEAAQRISTVVERLGYDPREEGLLIQKMAKPGREVILGMSTDPIVGRLILFGMGGKYVEVLNDVVLRVHPLTDQDAREMIEAIRGYPILQGVRGDAPVAFAKLEETLMRLSAFAQAFPEIQEIDLNPFLLSEDETECLIVDARILVSPADPG